MTSFISIEWNVFSKIQKRHFLSLSRDIEEKDNFFGGGNLSACIFDKLQ